MKSILVSLLLVASTTATLGAELGLRSLDDETPIAFPLQRTEVHVEISGFVARTRVLQIFENTLEEPAHVIYTFPLGDRAAVVGYEFRCDERTILGEIRRREEAVAEFQQALREGRRAALLEQERANIFTQSIAHLMPGDTVEVLLTMVEVLAYEKGSYEWLFPTVVSERYGAEPAMDAPRLPAQAPAPRVIFDVRLDAGVPVSELASPSHEIIVDRADERTLAIRNGKTDRHPDKDFILRWQVGAESPEIGFLTHRDGVDGYFTLLVQPRAEIEAGEATPKDVLLVLDTSGSMDGMPLLMSKRFARDALQALGPDDTFNLIQFAGGSTSFAAGPQGPERVDDALRWLERLESGGGTEMLKGLKRALATPREDRYRLRMVIFLTDGFIGADDAMVAASKIASAGVRVFTLGLGNAVNHDVLRRMAEAGRGAYTYIRDDREAPGALKTFGGWIHRPYLTHLSLDWGGLPVLDAIPEAPADLFSGQTLQLVGRFAGGGSGTLTVRGRLAGVPWEKSIDITLPDRESRHQALGPIWARGAIHELMMENPLQTTEESREEIVRLALEHRLMTRYTAFVAVDDGPPINPDGDALPVHQPVPGMIDTRTETRFDDEFVQGLPVRGRYYTDSISEVIVENVTVYAEAHGAGYGAADLNIGLAPGAWDVTIVSRRLELREDQRRALERLLADLDGDQRIAAFEALLDEDQEAKLERVRSEGRPRKLRKALERLGLL